MRHTAALLVASVAVASVAVASVAARATDGAPRARAADQDTQAATERELLRELAWLSGTWATRSADGVTTEEHWRPLAGTLLLGSSHTFDDERTRFFEYLRIAPARGSLAYVASPAGRGGTSFALAGHGTGAEGALVGSFAVFENGENDAPQRIRYERTASGLCATISQLDGSGATSWEFTAR